MTWHLEPITLHARRYVEGESFEARDKYATIVTVQILNGSMAYLSGMLSDGERITIRKEDIAQLGEMLRLQYGILVIHAERRSQAREYDTSPAPLR